MKTRFWILALLIVLFSTGCLAGTEPRSGPPDPKEIVIYVNDEKIGEKPKATQALRRGETGTFSWSAFEHAEERFKEIQNCNVSSFQPITTETGEAWNEIGVDPVRGERTFVIPGHGPPFLLLRVQCLYFPGLSIERTVEVPIEE